MPYYLLNPDGTLKSIIDDSPFGASVIGDQPHTTTEPPNGFERGWRCVDGEWEAFEVEEEPGVEARVEQQDLHAQAKVPSLTVQQQLDMLWRAMDAGEIPMADEFYQARKAVLEDDSKSRVFEVGKMP